MQHITDDSADAAQINCESPCGSHRSSPPAESADVSIEHLSCSFAHLLQKFLLIGIWQKTEELEHREQ